MNLNEQLQARSERGVAIGSEAMLARLDTALTATSRPALFTRPGIGFVAAAVVTLILVGGALWALRPDSEPAPVVDTTITTTTEPTATTAPTTTAAPEQSTTTSTEAVDAALANRRFVWAFQPGIDNPEDLRAALETYDGYKYDLVRLIDEGDEATRGVVFEYLKRPSAWGVQTLALMQKYGSPTGNPQQPAPWPSAVKWDILSTLQEAAQATFGQDAELVVDLQLATVAQELRFCAEELGGCDWGDTWYAAPEVVTSVSGERTGSMFVGTMRTASDTGAGGEVSIRALLTDAGWQLLEGYRTVPPFLSVSQATPRYSTNEGATISGYADPAAEVTLDGRWTAVDPLTGYWIDYAWDTTPKRGDNAIEVKAALPDGATTTLSVEISYLPDAVEQFAFIRGIDTAGDTPALIVDFAEFLGGDEAVQAAIEDGELSADQADEGLPNDFYIRNRNPLLRTLALAADADIYLLDYTIGDEFDLDAVTVAELVRIMETGDESAYYGGVTDSTVTLVILEETILQVLPQYVP